MKNFLLAMALCAVATSPLAASQNNGHPTGGGHPSGGGHVSNAGHTTFGNWHPSAPVSHAAPPAVHPQPAPPHVGPNQTINGTPYFRGTTHYTNPQPLNTYYAAHANAYPHASWVYANGARWYNGYWHQHWSGANWLWFRGFYGFWFPLNAIDVFVYEEAPGVCEYWDGYEWVPYYDPQTGYYCPY